ncbi:MAG: hypothetical protein ACRD6X_16335 [Pyrinomonadaceae bacterium]
MSLILKMLLYRSDPVVAVEGAVFYGFADVGGIDVRADGEVGDGSVEEHHILET